MTAPVGRFAPSPTGPLHAGSMVAALASWLDARVQGGRWLVRIEDADHTRCDPAATPWILRQLHDCGLIPDEPPISQLPRAELYQAALSHLVAEDMAYPCGCTRKDIDLALQATGHAHEAHAERIYPGTCRHGLHGKPARAWRFATWSIAEPHEAVVHWSDRRLGPQSQDVAAEVGDFVLKRADDVWSYQLAVVVDDAAQGVTDVVRGEDLTDNTARQILLQRALELPTPRYLHTPLVRASDGAKLSKQHGAPACVTDTPAEAISTLRDAARVLGLPEVEDMPEPAKLLRAWLPAWSALYNPRP